jgi:spore maturation protein CgeB
LEEKMTQAPIIFAAAKYAYNKETLGLSYEFQTVFKSLKSVYPDAIFIDIYQPNGTELLLNHLSSFPEKPRPKVIYTPYRGILGPTELNKISKLSEIGIFYLDDTWRQDLVQVYLTYCDWFTTSDPKYEWRYKERFAKKVKFFPFGYDADEVAKAKRSFEERDIRVSFVGACNDYRRFVVEKITHAGIDVTCFGSGWPNGPLSHEGFLDIIGRSKLSLNLSNSVNWDFRHLIKRPLSFLRNIKSGKKIEQFKARHIEIAALGACQLSFYNIGLENMFNVGEDIVLYPTIDELPYIINALSDDEVKEIAANGNAAVKEYSYQKQFKKILG